MMRTSPAPAIRDCGPDAPVGTRISTGSCATVGAVLSVVQVCALSEAFVLVEDRFASAQICTHATGRGASIVVCSPGESA